MLKLEGIKLQLKNRDYQRAFKTKLHWSETCLNIKKAAIETKTSTLLFYLIESKWKGTI